MPSAAVKPKPITHVVDASALLAVAREERGAKVVLDLLDQVPCVASSVNMAEVGAKLIDLGLPVAELATALAQFDVDVIPFDLSHAVQSAALRDATKAQGLSLGDRACLGLAQQLGAIAVTADSAWLKVQDAIGVQVRLIR